MQSLVDALGVTTAIGRARKAANAATPKRMLGNQNALGNGAPIGNQNFLGKQNTLDHGRPKTYNPAAGHPIGATTTNGDDDDIRKCPRCLNKVFKGKRAFDSFRLKKNTKKIIINQF